MMRVRAIVKEQLIGFPFICVDNNGANEVGSDIIECAAGGINHHKNSKFTFSIRSPRC